MSDGRWYEQASLVFRCGGCGRKSRFYPSDYLATPGLLCSAARYIQHCRCGAAN